MTQLHIIFLGTGGSWPTVKRNVSAVAIKRGSEVLLFDCGEGTQRQFQKSNLSYMQVSKIFLTHYHGDHFLGIPGLIQTMQLNDRNTPLYIYGPRGIDGLVHQLLTLGYFKPQFTIIAQEVNDGDTIEFEDYDINVLSVKHNVPAVAYSLTEHKRPGKFNKQKALELQVPEGPLFSTLQKGRDVTLKNGRVITPEMVLGPSRSGRKIVISGDTKPYNKLITFSLDADVLVHEATFESSMGETAAEYGHTTALQAAEIAKQAGVERLYMTHISPRYLDSKNLEHEARTIFKHSFIPKDFQEIEVNLKK